MDFVSRMLPVVLVIVLLSGTLLWWGRDTSGY